MYLDSLEFEFLKAIANANSYGTYPSLGYVIGNASRLFTWPNAAGRAMETLVVSGYVSKYNAGDLTRYALTQLGSRVLGYNKELRSRKCVNT